MRVSGDSGKLPPGRVQRRNCAGLLLALAALERRLCSAALVADRLDAGLKASGQDFIRRGQGAALPATPGTSRRAGAQAHQENWACRPRVSFNSMLFHGDLLQLASIRAVPGDFPLRRRWSSPPSAPPRRPARSGSPPLWAMQLGAKVGRHSEVGSHSGWTVAGAGPEPGSGFSSFQ